MILPFDYEGGVILREREFTDCLIKLNQLILYLSGPLVNFLLRLKSFGYLLFEKHHAGPRCVSNE
jgi:hypothetical protein